MSDYLKNKKYLFNFADKLIIVLKKKKMRSNIGTSAFGLRLPIIKEGDFLKQIIVEQLKNAFDSKEYQPQDNDIIGITESVVARAYGLYCTVDNMVATFKALYPNDEVIYVYNPIYSRNRFSIILRALAKYFKNVYIIGGSVDEVGNHIKNSLTGIDIVQFYEDIVTEMGADYAWYNINYWEKDAQPKDINIIDCTLHKELYGKTFSDEFVNCRTLKNICNHISEWGLLGSNKVNEETLKLYPDSNFIDFVYEVKKEVETLFNISNVNVMIYGDGCFKDASSGIWEFADPVVSPVYTKGLEGKPYELKLKYLADESKYDGCSSSELQDSIIDRIKSKNDNRLIDNMEVQGTTPRNFVNLLGSLMDLMSGSGDKGTPVIVVQNYFKNYAND